MRRLFEFFTLLSLLSTIGVCGYVIPDLKTITLSPGEMKEVAFTFKLEPGEINATIYLQNPQDNAWITPSDYFPKTFSQNQDFNFVVKVPEGYSQPSKNITFIVASGNSTITNTTFTLSINVNLPTPYYKVFGGTVAKGDSLLLPSGSKIIVKYVSPNSVLLNLFGCDAETKVVNVGENSTFSCAGIDYMLELNWCFENIADVTLYSSSITANVTKIEGLGEEEINLFKLSAVCPGKLTIIKTAPGTITVTDSKNMAIGTFTSSSGYYQFIVPEKEETMLSVRVTSTTGEEKIFPLEIDRECSVEENKEKKLTISLLNNNPVIGVNEDVICVGGFVKDNSTHLGVRDAAVVVFNDEIQTYQSGIAGYVRLCFNHSGSFKIYAEKEGYEPSDIIEVTVGKEQKPEVSVFAYTGGRKVEGSLPYDKLVTFKLLSNNETYRWSGEVEAEVVTRSGEKETITLSFHNGVSDTVDVSKYKKIKVKLSEVEEFDASDERFTVASPPSPNWFIILLLYVVLPAGMIILLKVVYDKVKGKKKKRSSSRGGFALDQDILESELGGK